MEAKRFTRDALGWGALLWLIGYILGIALFMMVPTAAIGWIITPVATAFTWWVLIRKVDGNSLGYYLGVGFIWTILAVVLDYFFIVKAFNPPDGYYKTDVYMYYALTFILPVIAGMWKMKRASNKERIM